MIIFVCPEPAVIYIEIAKFLKVFCSKKIVKDPPGTIIRIVE